MFARTPAVARLAVEVAVVVPGERDAGARAHHGGAGYRGSPLDEGLGSWSGSARRPRPGAGGVPSAGDTGAETARKAPRARRRNGGPRGLIPKYFSITSPISAISAASSTMYPPFHISQEATANTLPSR